MEPSWHFLTKILQIIVIDTVLSGDNAVVIALASHRLPRPQRRLAILFGAVGAIALRILFTFVLSELLDIPLLQFGGGLLLLWIAIKLVQEEESEEQKIREAGTLLQAIGTIIVADLVMSLDNMLAVAGAARQELLLIMIGLFVSIAIIMTCSTLIADLMNRLPVLVTAGAAVLAWTAGDMMLDDRKTSQFLIGRTQLCISGRWHRHFEAWYGAHPPQLRHQHWIGWLVLIGMTLLVISIPHCKRRLGWGRCAEHDSAQADPPTDPAHSIESDSKPVDAPESPS
jgi:YjbE family integral membrane protein